jgi:hypothetical protein
MSISDVVTLIVAALALVVSVATFIRTERRERERIERERTAELRDQSGKPTTEYLGRNGLAFQFQVANVGKSHLLHLEPSLIDPNGKVIATPTKRYLPGLNPE